MILGDVEFTAYRDADEQWVSADEVEEDEKRKPVLISDKSPVHDVKLDPDQAEKQGEGFVLKSDPAIRINSRAYKMSKARGNVVNPDEIVADYGADSLRSVRNVHGTVGAVETLEHGRRQRRAQFSRPRLADDRRRTKRGNRY